MSSYLTVRQFGSVAPEHRATLASLPAMLRLTETGTPDIALTASDGEAIRDAFAASPKAIVVARPAAITDAEADRLSDAALPIFPVLTLAASLRQIGAGRIPAKPGLVHSRLDWQGDMQEGMLEHFAGLASMVGELADVTLLSHAGKGYVGSAKTLDGTDVAWSGLVDVPAPRYELDVVGLAERLEIRAECDGSARPMMVRRGHADGLDQPIGIYETGLRLFWRGVADALAEGTPATQWRDIAALRDLIGAFTSVPSGDAV